MSRIGRSFPQSTGFLGSGMGEIPDSQNITVNLITNTGTVLDLTVQAGNTVTVALLTHTGTPFSLSVVQVVTAALLTYTGTPFALTVTGGVQDTGSEDDIRRFLMFGYPI